MLPGECWFDPSRRSLAAPFMPRSSSGRGRRSLTPEARVRCPLGVLHSTPLDASGDATRLSAGRGGFDSRRGRSSRRSSVGEHHAPTVEVRGFDSSRRDCVARLEASPRVVNPASRVRFPGDASKSSTTGRLGKRRSDTAVERGSIPRSSTSGRRQGRARDLLAVGEKATPPVLGTGDRWFDSSQPDLAR